METEIPTFIADLLTDGPTPKTEVLFHMEKQFSITVKEFRNFPVSFSLSFESGTYVVRQMAAETHEKCRQHSFWSIFAKKYLQQFFCHCVIYILCPFGGAGRWYTFWMVSLNLSSLYIQQLLRHLLSLAHKSLLLHSIHLLVKYKVISLEDAVLHWLVWKWHLYELETLWSPWARLQSEEFACGLAGSAFFTVGPQ